MDALVELGGDGGCTREGAGAVTLPRALRWRNWVRRQRERQREREREREREGGTEKERGKRNQKWE
jgi:hypothetical protein